MSSNFYETNRALSEYLLVHYGTPEQILPPSGGPMSALHYPVRCVSECVDPNLLPKEARALDLGCAVGRSAFELARHAEAVVGIDFSHRFIGVADHLKAQGSITYAYVEEGRLTIPATAVVPPEIDRGRVVFEQADAQALREDLGDFDVVLMANLIDRLREPRRCLGQMARLVKPGGQLILTSPYTWTEEYTPATHWLGGFEKDDHKVRTLDTLKSLFRETFQLKATRELPFLIREHARKYQWSVAQASIWIRS
jgi:putative 4-mercaptohistidine N1-methyltranferase